VAAALHLAQPVVVRPVGGADRVVRLVVSQLGRPDDGTDATGFSNAEFLVDLKPSSQWQGFRNKAELIDRMNAALSTVPSISFNFSQNIEDNVEEAVTGVKGELAVKLFDLPPGQALCPYHYEYVEEWLIVLEGELVLREPEGEEHLGRGDAVVFPAGPDGAHKVTNRASETARIMMFSSGREPAGSVYPDSDKIGVWPGNNADNLMARRAAGHLDYWDGEL